MKTYSSNATVELILGMILIGTVGAVVAGIGLDAVTIVFWRSLIGALFLTIWCSSRGIFTHSNLTWKSFFISLTAGVSLVLSWAAFFDGILRTSISTATIIFHTQPFWIVLIGAVLWKERISKAQTVWLCIAFVGLVLASNISLSNQDDNSNWTMGILILLGGSIIYAVTAVAGKELKGQRGEVTTLIQTIAGVLIFAPFINFEQNIALMSWGGLITIGVLQTGIAWVLVYSALPRVSTPMIAVLSFINPLTAIFTDWLFYDRLISPAQTIGMSLIIAGTFGVRLGWQPWRLALKNTKR